MVLLSLLVVAIASNIFLYVKYRQAQNNNPEIQTNRIVKEIRQMTTLPDETPSVVTVVDKDKLSNPALAKGAENGDKILMFPNEGKVIVYRPSTHKLINIFNLSTTAQPAATEQKKN